MIFSVFRMVVDEFWPALLYRVASVHCGLQVFKYAQLSYGLEAWTLSLSLQNRDSFFSPTLLYICCSSWGHCPVAWASLGQALAFIQMASHFTLKNLWHAEEFVVDSLTAKCITSSALLHCVDSWYEILVLCYFSPKVVVSYGQTSPLWLCLSKDASLWTNCGVTLVVEKRLLLANPSK